MITHLKLKGFRNFKEIDLDLGQLTVLIGPNNSGKTNFMDFFKLLSEAAARKLADGIARRGGLRRLLHADGQTLELYWRLTLDGISDSPCCYEATIREVNGAAVVWSESVTQSNQTLLRRKAGETAATLWNPNTQQHQKLTTDFHELALAGAKPPLGQPTLIQLRESLAGVAHYGHFATCPNAPIRQPIKAQPQVQLRPSGDNLTAVLYTLANTPKYKELYAELSRVASLVYSDVERFEVVPTDDDRIEFRWYERHFPEHAFSAAEISEGVLRLLCLLTIALNPDPPKLLCIESPEAGFHPSTLNLIAELLQHASRWTQVIATTHSPQMLDYLEVSEIAVLEKYETAIGYSEREQPDGATMIFRLDAGELKYLLKDFSLGELWRMGELGGNP